MSPAAECVIPVSYTHLLRGLELVPPLSYNTFYKSGQIKTDHIHLLNGTMVRCVQTQLQQGNRQVGMLITMLPDSSRRKKTADTQKFVARHQWKDLVGDSVAITQAMTAGKQLAQTEEHIMIPVSYTHLAKLADLKAKGVI